MSETPPRTSRFGRHGMVALTCAGLVAIMVGAAYASVPLYNLFCRVTGFGGTPLVAQAEKLPAIKVLDRQLTIRFDTNIANGLPWTFRAKEPTMLVRVGEIAEATFIIENLSDKPTVGNSVYNVTPPQTGGYFTKIQCFCFDAQPLAPGERLEVPVVFYVDPAFVDDRDTRGLGVITLSYTYFPHVGGGSGVGGEG
ncbi:cytochrome c oxidase assembly protein [Acuticoccus sp. M5D2P5]|uniref:cytochrome c oxidase assembly protein n=1 Tax=Acuticoccus kalidii TaxID=2910977 RepID=UPI001F42B098|nr:cytochrome c oxidase assembly protein [Acuticoccus kalidii]MCF3933505.1 cytochrome c oxidase assembly protein [Acuticoccus kalidii]